MIAAWDYPFRILGEVVMRRFIAGLVCLAFGVSSAAPAFAQYGMDKKGPKNAATPELPHCDRPLGRAAIQEPESRWWEGLGLSNPKPC